MPCVIVLVILCLLGILFFLTCLFIAGLGASQKHKRAKTRAIEDKGIRGQEQLETSEINMLIDELSALNTRLIGESEEDSVRINNLREIRNDT